jgi:hypothetical protein
LAGHLLALRNAREDWSELSVRQPERLAASSASANIGEEVADEPGPEGNAREELLEPTWLSRRGTSTLKSSEPGELSPEKHDATPRERLAPREDDHGSRRDLTTAERLADLKEAIERERNLRERSPELELRGLDAPPDLRLLLPAQERNTSDLLEVA